MANKRLVRELEDKEHFQSFFIALDKTLGTDKNGKAYLTVHLRDASGLINARAFERVDELSSLFESGDFIWIKGYTQNFMGRLQVIVQDLRKAEIGEVLIDELIPSADGHIEGRYEDLMKTLNSLEDEWIRRLCVSTLSDLEVKGRLLKAPAAKSIHHAYLGGLLEHIVSIVGVMEFFAKHYDQLNRDLLIFGAVFHDIGKLWELGIEKGIQYTTQGRLVGHMAIACELVDRKAGAIEGFPADLKDCLKHIILSHHGKHEYGSPQLPMFPEAVVVAMVDDMDSKLNTMTKFIEAELEQLPPDQNWTRFHPQFERYFYLDFCRKRGDR